MNRRLHPYAAQLGIVQAYFTSKGAEAVDRFFWQNTRSAYKWLDRGQLGPS